MKQDLVDRTEELHPASNGRATYKRVAIGRTAVGALATGAFATGARAIGLFSLGALGLGTIFIGRMAVRRLLVRDLKIKRLEIEELRLERLVGQGQDRVPISVGDPRLKFQNLERVEPKRREDHLDSLEQATHIAQGSPILKNAGSVRLQTCGELEKENQVAEYAINHEVGIKASPSSIYEALTDTKKLGNWWISDARGDGSKVGGVLEFSSGEYLRKFEVVELQPGKLVRWRWKGDEKDEWAGTEVAFKMTEDKNQCWLNFSHSGFYSDQGCLPHCSTKWAVFMLSLKDLLENGKGQPAPNDVQINHDKSEAEDRQSA